MHIIFDIDGTLADASERLKHITGEGKAKDWDAFFAAENMGADKRIRTMTEFAAALSWNHYLIFVTGRPERTRQITADWLLYHVGGYGIEITLDHLLMRADDDRRPSHEVKRDHLHALRAKGIHPQLAFEDRKADAEMYRAEGLICALIGDGDF